MLYGVGDFFQPVAVFCCQCFYCLLHGNCVGVGGIGGKKDAIGRAGHKGHKADDIFFAFMKECRYNRTISLKREVSPMNLYISAAEYDYHTLLKVAEMAGLAGIIGFHEAGDGYLVTFPQGENVQALIDDYKGRLRDLENNIWQH